MENPRVWLYRSLRNLALNHLRDHARETSLDGRCATTRGRRRSTVEENAALRGIAGRLVDQHLPADSVAGSIDVMVPQRGQVLTFTRSVPVEADVPLALRLEIGRIHQVSVWWAAVLLAGMGGVAATAARRTASEVAP